MLGRIALITGMIFSFIIFSCKLSFGQITQTDLRAYTEYALKNNLIEYDPPKLDWDNSGVRYNLGGISECVNITDDVLSIPLQEQFIVTGIRFHRAESQQKSFWRPVLERVEREITKMLNIINRNDKDPTNLYDDLEVYQKRINSIYYQALDELARERGGKAKIFGEAKPCAAHVSKIMIEPSNGQVARISAGKWSYYIFFKDKRNLQEPQWESLPVGEGADLYGKNWIQAEWPDGPKWKKLYDLGMAECFIIRPSGILKMQ